MKTSTWIAGTRDFGTSPDWSPDPTSYATETGQTWHDTGSAASLTPPRPTSTDVNQGTADVLMTAAADADSLLLTEATTMAQGVTLGGTVYQYAEPSVAPATNIFVHVGDGGGTVAVPTRTGPRHLPRRRRGWPPRAAGSDSAIGVRILGMAAWPGSQPLPLIMKIHPKPARASPDATWLLTGNQGTRR